MAKNKKQEQQMSEKNYMDQYAGEGYDNISGDMYSTPFIKLLQSNSSEVVNGVPGAKAGHFWNDRDSEDLGPSIDLIPVNLELLWLEWEKDMGGLKGKYLPNSIPSSGDAFARINPATGRDLVDTWSFYVLLAGREQDGMFITAFPVTSIKYLKIWNDMIYNTRLDNGKRAAFFSSIWKLGPTALGMPNKSGQRWYNIGDVSGAFIKREGFVPEETFPVVIEEWKKSKTRLLSYSTPPAIAAPATRGAIAAPTESDKF
jgi:hypothetical protein